MQEIKIDLCNLPEVDGFRHLIVCLAIFQSGRKQKLLKVNFSQLQQAFYMKSFVEKDVLKYK